MLITYSRHADNLRANKTSHPSDFLPLSHYMDAPRWVKRVDGKKRVAKRSPVPEILLGDAELLRSE